MKIDCIIVENEPLAAEKVKRYLLKIPYLNLLGSFNNGQDALFFLKANKVALIFLDINLGRLSGIKLLESNNITSQVIFTTAYEEYALKGYELNITDYLLKPFTFERFFQAVEKAKACILRNEAKHEIKYIFIKTEYRIEKVALDDILYIAGMGNYRQIHLSNKRIMTLQTFKEFEQQIPVDVICRVHKSFMVSISKIESIEKERIKIKDILIPISEGYRKLFFEIISKA
jgi:two-component system LytT family response regulator